MGPRPAFETTTMENVRDFDIVVVGGGNAALSSALSASEAGAKVVVLEAANKDERGGNSRFAGAVFRIPHQGLNHLKTLLCDDAIYQTEKVDVGPYSAQEFTDDLMSVTKGNADPECKYTNGQKRNSNHVVATWSLTMTELTFAP